MDKIGKWVSKACPEGPGVKVYIPTNIRKLTGIEAGDTLKITVEKLDTGSTGKVPSR